MRIKEPNILRYLNLLFLIVFVVFFNYLIAQKVVYADSLEYQTTPITTNKFVKGPYPVGRIMANNQTWQIINEPVYFQTYAPRHFSSAQITLTYRKPVDFSVKLGVKMKGGEYAFYFLDFLNESEDWQTQTFYFNLSGADFHDNKLQFVVSAPGISTDQNLEIKQTEIILHK